MLRRIRYSLLPLLILPMYQNCAIKEPPPLARSSELNPNASVFHHTGFETSCVACHADSRPGPNEQVPLDLQVAINQSKAQFRHQDKYNGTGDCVNCHAADPNKVGVTWKSGIFDHVDAQGVKVTAGCADCHTPPTATPATTPAIAQDHKAVTGDCSSCHQKPGITWADGIGHIHNATADAGKCYTCHTGEMPIVSSLNTVSAVNKNYFSHAAVYTGTMGTNGADCSQCHLAVAANLGVSWRGGVFNHTQFASGTAPTSCIPCHTTGADKPAAATAFPANLRDSFVHNTNYLPNGDCRGCHMPKSTNTGATTAWQTGRWSGSPIGTHTTTGGTKVTTCLPCHNNREHRAGQECFDCHRNAGANWDRN